MPGTEASTEASTEATSHHFGGSGSGDAAGFGLDLLAYLVPAVAIASLRRKRRRRA